MKRLGQVGWAVGPVTIGSEVLAGDAGLDEALIRIRREYARVTVLRIARSRTMSGWHKDR
ncbi:MAG: hypothetical protein H8K08_01135 [Nitrospira sp.]|jgi:hypothetical protein|nr:hypothetical protein [Nitrospira sp.]